MVFTALSLTTMRLKFFSRICEKVREQRRDVKTVAAKPFLAKCPDWAHHKAAAIAATMADFTAYTAN